MARGGALVERGLPIVRVGPFRVIREGLVYGGLLAALTLLGARRLGTQWTLSGLGLAAVLASFFRDPDREVPDDPRLIVSPADGTVTEIEPIGAGGEHATRVSIVLTLMDVHVTRSPASGRVVHVDYRPGKFGNALVAAAAAENERNVVRVEGEQGAVVFTQIAGMLARRIVFWPRVGDWIERGERVGIIKFSSRVDVLVPRGAELLVHVGERVFGGSSPLARVPATASAGACSGSRPGSAT